MRNAVRTSLAVALAVAAVLAVATLAALEGGEVAVLRTRAADGTLRRTRVWVADEAGSAWIEAASPERPFYADIQRDPRVEMVRGGEALRYVAHPVEGSEGHAKVRALLRANYGLADRWIGLLVDTSRSVAVRLAPLPG